MVPCSLYLGAPVAFFAFFARLAKVDLVRAAARVQSLARYKVPLGHRPVRGSYLVSCVFYGVLTGRPSVGLPYIPGEIGAEARVYLQVMVDRARLGERRRRLCRSVVNRRLCYTFTFISLHLHLPQQRRVQLPGTLEELERCA